MSHSDIVNIVTSDLTENTENDETDSFSDGGDLGCLSAGTGWFRFKISTSKQISFSDREQFLKWIH